MVLNNFRRILSMAYYDSFFGSGNSLTLTDMNGDEVSISVAMLKRSLNGFGNAPSDQSTIVSGNANLGTYLIVGSGQTEATNDDYTMENLITFTPVSYAANRFNAVSSDEKGIPFCNLTQVYKNDELYMYTVREIGIASVCNTLNGGILLAREVLDNPIYIASKETYAFNVTINL